MRHDNAAYEADADYAQTHWYAHLDYRSVEHEEYRRHATEEGQALPEYDPNVRLAGPLAEALAAARAALREAS